MDYNERDISQDGFVRTEWGVVDHKLLKNGELTKKIDIPQEIDMLVSFSQYIAEIFSNCEIILFNIDFSIPIYPHERIIIDNFMKILGDYYDGDIFLSSRIKISENKNEKLSILSCAILTIIFYRKSLQLFCKKNSNLFVYINSQGLFCNAITFSHVFSLIKSHSFSDLPPAQWVLDMLSQSQSNLHD